MRGPHHGGRGPFQAGGLLVVGAAGWLGVAACAKEMPPPGAHPDQIPPVVESIRPAPDSIVAGFDGQVEIQFNEPVDFPNDIARRLFASPMEEYEADIGFSKLRLRPRAGWRDSVVYCLSIPPDGISDKLRNRMEVETAFCFSTGIEIADTRVTGTVIDGVTRLPQSRALVVFMAPGDSIPYGAITDEDGRFSARALPPGEYEAFGFADQNRNLALDRQLEPHDSATFTAAPAEVTELHFAIVSPDTTPPLLVGAEAVDSFTVQLEFDDYLLNPPDEVPVVVVRDSASSAQLEVVAVRVGTPAEVDFPVPDSTPTDPFAIPVDSLGVTPDSLGVVPDSLGGIPEPSEPPADPFPSRFVSVRLASALDSATYFVEVRGVVNLRHLVGGGDTAFVAAPEPPVPDSAVSELTGLDSLPGPADTAVGVADSVAAVTDTLRARADTLRARADTLRARPDMVSAPPPARRSSARRASGMWR